MGEGGETIKKVYVFLQHEEADLWRARGCVQQCHLISTTVSEGCVIPALYPSTRQA